MNSFDKLKITEAVNKDLKMEFGVIHDTHNLSRSSSNPSQLTHEF